MRDTAEGSPGDAGFTLVEALVALLMLAVILAGMAGAAIAGLTSVRHEKDSLAANQFANQTAEQLRGMAWADVAPADPAVTRTIAVADRSHGGTRYVAEAVATWMDDPCNGTSSAAPAGGAPHPARDYLKLGVVLTWTNAKGRQRTLRLETFRVPTHLERKPARVDTLVSPC